MTEPLSFRISVIRVYLQFGFRIRISGLVPEVSHSRKDHGDIVFIRGCDHLIVPDGAAGLDDGHSTRLCCLYRLRL